MRRYNGTILDEHGFVEFDFTTPLMGSRDRAEDLAREILAAWKATHADTGTEYFFWLEG